MLFKIPETQVLVSSDTEQKLSKYLLGEWVGQELNILVSHYQKMQVPLPVSMKAKLLKQMLVQKERGFTQLPHRRMADFHLKKDHLPLLCKTAVLIKIVRGGLPPSTYPMILLAIGDLGPYPFIFLSLGELSVRTSPGAILANRGDFPVLWLTLCGKSDLINKDSSHKSFLPLLKHPYV